MALAAAYAVRCVFAVVFLAITACGDGKSREGRQPVHDSASADRSSPRGLVQWKFTAAPAEEAAIDRALRSVGRMPDGPDFRMAGELRNPSFQPSFNP